MRATSSAPVGGGSATTSAHVDFECNFLLVTEGRKRVYIADVPDEQGELALEAMHSGLYGTCGEIPSPMTAFDLAPGEGVFLPPRAAHYVENGPDPCTALSVVFFHRNSQRQVRSTRSTGACDELVSTPDLRASPDSVTRPSVSAIRQPRHRHG